jgi:23S rRNA pseudouridine1911/1915/1917 synthase
LKIIIGGKLFKKEDVTPYPLMLAFTLIISSQSVTNVVSDKEVSDDDEATRFVVPESLAGGRLDKVLATLMPEHSRGRIQNWVEAGYVEVNQQPTKIRHITKWGDVISVWAQPAPEDLAYKPEDVTFDVVSESSTYIVVQKPVGLVTHPGSGNWGGTLLNGLLFRYPELAIVPRAGIVHRLDKDTSGLMVVARTEIAQTHLVRQMQARSVSRTYVALVHGRTLPQGTINRPVGRDQRVPVRMTTENPSAPREAITHYTCRQAGHYDTLGVSELICKLETGRTHQIRAHMASLGHPLLGDTLYGGRMAGSIKRQMLHAYSLAFDDPQTQSRLAFESSLPADMQEIVDTTVWNHAA